MRAVTTAGGGVMFIPEKLERKGAVSYADLLAEEKKSKKKIKLFGKRTPIRKGQQAAA